MSKKRLSFSIESMITTLDLKLKVQKKKGVHGSYFCLEFKVQTKMGQFEGVKKTGWVMALAFPFSASPAPILVLSRTSSLCLCRPCQVIKIFENLLILQKKKKIKNWRTWPCPWGWV